MNWINVNDELPTGLSTVAFRLYSPRTKEEKLILGTYCGGECFHNRKQGGYYNTQKFILKCTGDDEISRLSPHVTHWFLVSEWTGVSLEFSTFSDFKKQEAKIWDEQLKKFEEGNYDLD